jgi:glucokinase
LSFTPVIVAINDANAAAFGENSVLPKPYENIVFYTLGTGIGGGIIINSNLIEGSHGLAGEIGHMRVSDDPSDICGCGRVGCLETKCATRGILRTASELLKEGKYKTTLTENTLKTINIFNTRDEELSSKIIEVMVKELAKSAVNIALIVDPEVFIIGGGISLTGQWLIDKIQAQYKKHARFSTSEIPFILATLQNDAGFTGAAYYVKSKIK